VKLDEAEYPVKLDEADVPVTLEEEAYAVKLDEVLVTQVDVVNLTGFLTSQRFSLWWEGGCLSVILCW